MTKRFEQVLIDPGPQPRAEGIPLGLHHRLKIRIDMKEPIRWRHRTQFQRNALDFSRQTPISFSFRETPCPVERSQLIRPESKQPAHRRPRQSPTFAPVVAYFRFEVVFADRTTNRPEHTCRSPPRDVISRHDVIKRDARERAL